MKKVYIKPDIEIVAYSTNYIIAGTLEEGGDTIGEGDGEEATSEFRGAWNDIWKGM